MKRRVFEVLNAVQPEDRVAQTIDVLLTLLIVLNVLALILSTMDDIFRTAPRAFRLFEIDSVIVFTTEYAARVWSCTTDPRYSGLLRGRLRFMASPLVAIDAAAIMPFYILMFIGTGALDLRALRILRLVARVARLTRYSEGIRSLTAAVGGRSQELLTTVGLMLVLLLLASSLMYFVENDAQPEKFSSIPDAMWWGIITLTTVGYGDVVPVTNLGRVIVGVVAVMGIALFAVTAGILTSSFLEQLEQRRSKETRICPHCGKETQRMARSSTIQRNEWHSKGDRD